MRKLPPLPVVLPLLALCLVPTLLHAMPAPQRAATTRSHQGIWQLKARSDARVAPLRETQAKLEVIVTQSGNTAESVTLSNALEIAPQPRSERCLLRFRLRATKSQTIRLTLQSAGKVFWSGEVAARSEWKEACLPVSLASCKTAQAILTFPLGAQTGEVSLADVRLEPTTEE